MSRSCRENSHRSKFGAPDVCLPFSAPFSAHDGHGNGIALLRLNYAATHAGSDIPPTNRNPNRAARLAGSTLPGFFPASIPVHAAVGQLPPDPETKSRFDGVLQLLDAVLDQVRSAVGLSSPASPHVSLGEALASVPDDLGFPASVGFRVAVCGWQRELPAGLHDEIYRIGREAIENALRHSGAPDIETEIEYRPTELRITIRDNGCGINPEDLQWGRNGHRGLQGMRARAERIGGRLRLLSKVGLGTEVELCVPTGVESAKR
jgi:hypothetical protein